MMEPCQLDIGALTFQMGKDNEKGTDTVYSNIESMVLWARILKFFNNQEFPLKAGFLSAQRLA